MVTSLQEETFEARGVLRLERLIPTEKISPVRDVVFRHLAQKGIWRDGSWDLAGHPLSAPVNVGARLVRGLKGRKEYVALVEEQVENVVSELMDEQTVSSLGDCPQILFTLPNAERWTVPSTVWHLDLPRLPETALPGIQIFTFLNTVEPGGGGTLVVAGSHRLLNENERISSKDVKQRLKEKPYFRELMSHGVADRDRFVREVGHVDDVEVQVVELHGQPGDVFFVDMRVLHTVAPNASSTPRVMMTHRYLLESLHEEAYASS